MQRNHVVQWSIVQDRQKYRISRRNQVRNLHATSRHKGIQALRHKGAQACNDIANHGTPSGDHVLRHARSTTASTKTKKASSRYSSQTAPTHFAPHQANLGNILNPLRQNRPDSHVAILSRSKEFSQKLRTFKKKSEKSCKYSIVARSNDHLPNTTWSPHSPLPYQEQKKRSIDQHLQTLIDTGKFCNQKLQKEIFILFAYNNTLYMKLEKCTGKNQNHSTNSENTQQEHCTNSNHEPSKISGKLSTLLYSCFDYQQYLQYTSLSSLAIVNKIENLDHSSTTQKPATFGTASLPLEVCSQNLIATNALQL